MKVTSYTVAALALVQANGVAAQSAAQSSAEVVQSEQEEADGSRSEQQAVDDVEPSGRQETTAPVNAIIVTAQRREQYLQDVPISITALSEEQLTKSGVVSTEQLNVLVPGLNIRSTSSSFQPSIRGVGTSSINVENPVALYIDGVYYPYQREGIREFSDIEQLTVLRGPQGTLFGRNATAGVIQITTRPPTYDFRGEVGVSLDNYATLRTDVYASGGLSDNLSASLSVGYVTQGEGGGDNFTTGVETYRIDHDWRFRGKLRFEPSPATELNLIADYTNRQDTMGPYFLPLPGTKLLVPGSADTGNVYDSTADEDPDNRFDGGGVSLEVEHDFDFATLVNILAYRDSTSHFSFDVDGTGTPVFNSISTNHNRSISEELRLASSAGDWLQWTAGIFYFNNKVSNEPLRRQFFGPLAPLPTSVAETYTFAQETTEALGPFAQVEVSVSPRLNLTVGGRWTYERRELEANVSALLNNGTEVTSVGAPIDHDALEVRKLTWRFAADYEFTDSILGYASYNRGFKSGGFNIANPASAPYRPENLDAYELGLKTEPFGGLATFNVGAFYYGYSNIQVIQFPGGIQSVTNGAAAELYGAEAELALNPGGGFNLSGGISLVHAEFTDFADAAFTIPRPGGGASVTIGDASGNRLPLSQKVSGYLAVDYEADVDFGILRANVTANHNGQYYLEPDNFASQPAYQIINASIGIADNRESISGTIFVRNLLDERVIAQSAGTGFGFITTYTFAPRTYGMSLRYEF